MNTYKIGDLICLSERAALHTMTDINRIKSIYPDLPQAFIDNRTLTVEVTSVTNLGYVTIIPGSSFTGTINIPYQCIHLFKHYNDKKRKDRIALFQVGAKIQLKDHLIFYLNNGGKLFPDISTGSGILSDRNNHDSIGTIAQVSNLSSGLIRLSVDFSRTDKPDYKGYKIDLGEGDEEFFNIVDTPLNNVSNEVHQFLNPLTVYSKGTVLIYMGSNSTQITGIVPEIKVGRKYTVKRCTEDFLEFEELFDKDDMEYARFSRTYFSFMELEPVDYNLVKADPDKMKEFAKTALQYIMNNPLVYDSVKNNIKYLENKAIFENSLK